MQASAVDGSREAVRAGIKRVLTRPRGVVPPGLDYFSIENFTRRTHRLVDQFVPSGKQAANRRASSAT